MTVAGKNGKKAALGLKSLSLLSVIYWSCRAAGAQGSTPPLSLSFPRFLCTHLTPLWKKQQQLFNPKRYCPTEGFMDKEPSVWNRERWSHCGLHIQQPQCKMTTMASEQLLWNYSAYLARSRTKACPVRKRSELLDNGNIKQGFQCWRLFYFLVLNGGTLIRLHPYWTRSTNGVLQSVNYSQVPDLLKELGRNRTLCIYNFISPLRPLRKTQKTKWW